MAEIKTAAHLLHQESGEDRRQLSAACEPSDHDCNIATAPRQVAIESLIPRGRRNAVTSAELAAVSGITTRRVTILIRRARLRGVPICSNGSGFWIAETDEDLRRCAARLHLRAAEIHRVASALQQSVVGGDE